jgi:hypothetical protein
MAKGLLTPGITGKSRAAEPPIHRIFSFRFKSSWIKKTDAEPSPKRITGADSFMFTPCVH